MNVTELSVRELHDEICRRYANSADFVARVNQTLDKYMITQADLSRVSGYGRGILNRWLRGRVEPPLHAKLVIDEALERLVEAEL